jgi:cell division protein ZapA
MAQITVTVNDKHYPLACANGEEDRLHKLAAYVDNKTQALAKQLGHVSEARLMLMAAVLIADELHDSLDGKSSSALLSGLTEDDMASVLNEVASDIEAIAEKLTTD